MKKKQKKGKRLTLVKRIEKIEHWIEEYEDANYAREYIERVGRFSKRLDGAHEKYVKSIINLLCK